MRETRVVSDFGCWCQSGWSEWVIPNPLYSPKKRKYPASICALLMSGVRVQNLADWLEATGARETVKNSRWLRPSLAEEHLGTLNTSIREAVYKQCAHSPATSATLILQVLERLASVDNNWP